MVCGYESDSISADWIELAEENGAIINLSGVLLIVGFLIRKGIKR